MKLILFIIILSSSLTAYSSDLDDKQIKMQIGSEVMLEQYMNKNKIDDMDVIFRCKNTSGNKKFRCFVIDKKHLTK
jgi:hypothetical protein